MRRTTKLMEKEVKKITAHLAVNKLATNVADDSVADNDDASDSSNSSDSDTTDDTQDFQQGED